MNTYHPKAPRRYTINFGNENLILSSLFFIVIKHDLTKNLKKDDVLVIGRVTSSVEMFNMFMLHLYSVEVKLPVWSLFGDWDFHPSMLTKLSLLYATNRRCLSVK